MITPKSWHPNAINVGALNLSAAMKRPHTAYERGHKSQKKTSISFIDDHVQEVHSTSSQRHISFNHKGSCFFLLFIYFIPLVSKPKISTRQQ